MQNPNPQHDSALVIIGGLVAEVNAPNLPAGAAAIATDVDFTVGSVRTRDGLANVYVYEGADEENNAGLGVNVVIAGGTVWESPDNIIHDTSGTYASTTMNAVPVTPEYIQGSDGNYAGGVNPTIANVTLSADWDIGDTVIVFVAVGNISSLTPTTVSGITDSLGTIFSPATANLYVDWVADGGAGMV